MGGGACLICSYEMWSGPGAFLFLSCLRMVWISACVMGVVRGSFEGCCNGVCNGVGNMSLKCC